MKQKNKMKRVFCYVCLLLLFCDGFIGDALCDVVSPPVTRRARTAAISASTIPPEQVCQHYAARIEKTHGIPDKLLTAVSLTESGRSTVKGLVSWPWTLNAEGKGYYFSTKAEAIRAVQRLQAKGTKSIDVGCMQINLLHHPQAFSSLEEAFDPASNIAYGANFLKTLQKSYRNWGKAVAHYHSATPALHRPYQTKVLKTWLEEKQKKPTLFSQRRVPLHLANPRAFFGRAVSRTVHRTAHPPPPSWAQKNSATPSGESEVQRVPSQAIYHTRGKKMMKIRTSPSGRNPLSKRPSWLVKKPSQDPTQGQTPYPTQGPPSL
jgi:Transglycosylase SLT domain